MTLSVLLLWSHARADSADDARELYDRGAYAYRLQQWDLALDRFEAAYGASQAPEILFNIGQCQRQLGRYAAAAHSYRAYLAQLPEGGDEAAARRLADQMDAAARPTPGPNAQIAKKSPQVAVTTHVDGDGDVRVRSRRWYRRPAGMAVAGFGLASALVGGALLLASSGDDAAARRAVTLPDQRQLWDAGGELQTAGIITLALGGAGLAVGSVLLARRR